MKTKIESEKVIEVNESVKLSEKAVSTLEFLQNGSSDAPKKNDGLKDYQLQLNEVQNFILHQLDYGEAKESEVLQQLKNLHELSCFINSLAKP